MTFGNYICGQNRRWRMAGYCFTASRSMVSFTSSPTMAAGYPLPMPKAVRSMVVVAEKPTCGLWSMPGTGPFGPSTCRTTGLVTPWRVRLPFTVMPLADLAMPVLTKVAVGYLSVSKKPEPLISESRALSPVSTEVASIVIFTLDFETSASFHWMVPAILPNWPWTFDRLMCKMENPTSLCALSGTQVEACAVAKPTVDTRRSARKIKRRMHQSYYFWPIISARAGADFAARPIVECRSLEAVAHGELHAPSLCEQFLVLPICLGTEVRIVGDGVRIEAHRVGDVERLPGELELVALGQREGLRQARVDAEVAVAAVIVALAGLACLRRANAVDGRCLVLEGVGLPKSVMLMAAGSDRPRGYVPALVSPVGVPAQTVDRTEGQSARPVRQSVQVPAADEEVFDPV